MCNPEKAGANKRAFDCGVKFAGRGHLEKGDGFELEQGELFAGQWELTFVKLNMKGKAPFFKTIAVQQKKYRSDSHSGS